MELGRKISLYRKKLNLTQDGLAQQLGVTNQAVSKWEADQCCPDVQLLPALAELFGISLDELFDRTSGQPQSVVKDLPWPDDNTLHVVLYVGHKLVDGHPAVRDLTFTYEGPALNVDSVLSVRCGNIEGSVDAGVNVSCGNIGGNVDAGCNVTCGDIRGHVNAVTVNRK